MITDYKRTNKVFYICMLSIQNLIDYIECDYFVENTKHCADINNLVKYISCIKQLLYNTSVQQCCKIPHQHTKQISFLERNRI